MNGGNAVNGMPHDVVNQVALDAMNVVAPAAGMVVTIIVATCNDNYAPIVVGAAHVPRPQSPCLDMRHGMSHLQLSCCWVGEGSSFSVCGGHFSSCCGSLSCETDVFDSGLWVA